MVAARILYHSVPGAIHAQLFQCDRSKPMPFQKREFSGMSCVGAGQRRGRIFRESGSRHGDSAPCFGASAWGDRFHGWHRADGWRQHSRPQRTAVHCSGKGRDSYRVVCAVEGEHADEHRRSPIQSRGRFDATLGCPGNLRYECAVGSMVAGFSDDMVSIARLGAAEDRFSAGTQSPPNNCPATG